MDHTQRTDEQAVSLITQGDSAGIETLYDRYARSVFSLVLRIVGNQQVAEELTQEVFVRVWQQASSYSRSRGRFAGWILGIAHNIAIDEIRRRKARPQQVYEDDNRPSSFLDVADPTPEPDALAIGGLRREAILEALRGLPDDQRRVIEMAYFGGLTQSQIAERTGEALGTIKTRTRLGLQRLRSRLQSLGMTRDAF